MLIVEVGDRGGGVEGKRLVDGEAMRSERRRVWEGRRGVMVA